MTAYTLVVFGFVWLELTKGTFKVFFWSFLCNVVDLSILMNKQQKQEAMNELLSILAQ
jgi:hypothetical protein